MKHKNYTFEILKILRKFLTKVDHDINIDRGTKKVDVIVGIYINS